MWESCTPSSNPNTGSNPGEGQIIKKVPRNPQKKAFTPFRSCNLDICKNITHCKICNLFCGVIEWWPINKPYVTTILNLFLFSSGICYYASASKQSWSTATTECSSNQGRLANPKTWDEWRKIIPQSNQNYCTAITAII